MAHYNIYASFRSISGIELGKLVVAAENDSIAAEAFIERYSRGEQEFCTVDNLALDAMQMAIECWMPDVSMVLMKELIS